MATGFDSGRKTIQRRKQFFFEKKNQKTFVIAHPPREQCIQELMA
jgi:hypothetical protein